MIENGKYYCHICYDETDEEFVCETCEEHYCEDCSYTYSLHYQFQGGKCYECSGQSRLKYLDEDQVIANKRNIELEKILKK